MKQDTLTTDIVFRVGNIKSFNGAVFALLPYDFADRQGNVTYYEHLGQHSAADYNFCIGSSRAAKENEYADLKREMEGLGYKIRVIRKRNRHKYALAYLNRNK